MEGLTPELLKGQNRWVLALAVVKFDFDEGQLVEQVFPPNVLSKAEEKSMAMLSFPDSNAFDGNQGTLKYVFKMRRENGKSLFAFVCFKQKKDPSIFRGYFQKSLVILSQIPLLSFFSTLSEFLVFKLFVGDSLSLKLQPIYRQVTGWPAPQPLLGMQVGLLGYQFNITVPTYLPDHLDVKYRLNKPVLNLQDINRVGYYQETSILDSYKHIIPCLWSIWELTLLNKPLMIVADNPSVASNAVLAAISLISPLLYASEFKPYMTVYDSDFQDIQKQAAQRPDKLMMIIGVTNPLFVKTLKKIPNVVYIGCPGDNKGLVTRTRQDKEFSKLVRDLQVSQETSSLVESLIRRHFRKLTEVFMEQFQLYFLQQKNDLKRYDKEEFIKFIKSEKIPVGECFQSRRSLIKLYAQFCQSVNFHRFILSRNVIKTF